MTEAAKKSKLQHEIFLIKHIAVPSFFNVKPQDAKWYHVIGALAIGRKNKYKNKFIKTKAGKELIKVQRKIDYAIESYYESKNYRRWYDFKTEALLGFGLLKWVNAYTITREYGGPEEGGWWYNAYNCEESHLVFRWNLEKTLDKVRKEWDSVKDGDIYSVLGGTDTWIGEEKHRAESETTVRPRYE
jgi:hypothetical protein